MDQLTDQQILEGLRRKPYSRVCREAAARLEALLAGQNKPKIESKRTDNKDREGA